MLNKCLNLLQSFLFVFPAVVELLSSRIVWPLVISTFSRKLYGQPNKVHPEHPLRCPPDLQSKHLADSPSLLFWLQMVSSPFSRKLFQITGWQRSLLWPWVIPNGCSMVITRRIRRRGTLCWRSQLEGHFLTLNFLQGEYSLVWGMKGNLQKRSEMLRWPANL